MSSLPQIVPPALSTSANRWVRRYRLATGRNRRLPDFIIIGAQKAGTTSLFAYMSQHPQLAAANEKEIHFFDGGPKPDLDLYEYGEAWYRGHFPLKLGASLRTRTFEATPIYLFHPLVPKRMHDLVPDARLIAILRDPADRAISHYFHSKSKGFEDLPVLEAMQAEEQRLADVLATEQYRSHAFVNHSYKARGLYAQQIERFCQHYPREQLLVINSADMFTDPHRILSQAFEFVGVDPSFTVPDLKPRKVGQGKTKVDPAVYDYLNDYFRPHNQALYDLLGEDFGWSSPA